MVMRHRPLAVLSLLLATTGCTVTSERSAQRVPGDEVPFELLETTTSSSGSTAETSAALTVDVFLVRDERLDIVRRTTATADPANVLALLAAGPTQAETDAGLRTALVPELAEIVTVDPRSITIDLDGDFSALAPTEQRLALAQITFAMTQLTSIDDVRFTVGGEPASVPRGDGTSTDQPVNPSDYAEFAPP